MSTTSSPTAAPIEARFTSPEQLTIANAAVVYHELDAVLRESECVVFDLAQTDRVDTAGVQLLLAATRQARDLGVEVRCEDPNHRLTEASAALGLTSAFAIAQGENPLGSPPSSSGEE